LTNVASFKHTPEKHFEWWANMSTIHGKVHVPITSCEKYFKLLRTHSFKCVQLKYRTDGFYLNVIFEEEKPIPSQKDFKHFVGVDRGSHNNLATLVVQDREGNIIESKFYPAGQLLEKRRRFLVRRQLLGKKKLLKEIRKTKDKEKQYVKDMNQNQELRNPRDSSRGKQPLITWTWEHNTYK